MIQPQKKKRAKVSKVPEAPTKEVVPEVAVDNLTGGQIQDILDLLMFESVAPIVRASDVFDIQLIHILTLTARNRKRKLSALKREDFINNLCQALSVKSRERKIEIISEAKIERGFIYKFVMNFLREASDYVVVYQQHLVCRDELERRRLEAKLEAVERSLHTSRDVMFSTLHTTQDYLDLMYAFRNSIVQNYVRFAFQQAKAFTAQKGENFDFNDVYQNFLTIVTKAIDKYDASKGALTSYIRWWILNAQTTSNPEYGHEYGIAYTVPQMQKKNLATNKNGAQQVNFSISLSQLVGPDGDESELEQHIQGDEGIDLSIERRQELDQVRYLVKKADIKGMARLQLEIDEVFSPKELRRMRETMREQLGTGE